MEEVLKAQNHGATQLIEQGPTIHWDVLTQTLQHLLAGSDANSIAQLSKHTVSAVASPASGFDEWRPSDEQIARADEILDAWTRKTRPYNLTASEHFHHINNIMLPLMNTGRYTVQGFAEPSLESIESYDKLCMIDPALARRMGAQYFLYGGTVYQLGTERHWQMLEAINHGRQLGCFALAEQGHSSHLANLETTATYDATTQTFSINSPTRESIKFWVEGANNGAHHAVVLARLIMRGDDYGVHAWHIPIRDDVGTPLPGVTLGDCGNDANSGYIRFDHYKVARTTLLNRLADVLPDGTYVQKVSGSNLGTVLEGLVTAKRSACSELALATRISTKLGSYAGLHPISQATLMTRAYAATHARTLAAQHRGNSPFLWDLHAWITDTALESQHQVLTEMSLENQANAPCPFHRLGIYDVVRRSYATHRNGPWEPGDAIYARHLEQKMLAQVESLMAQVHTSNKKQFQRCYNVFFSSIDAVWKHTHSWTERHILGKRLAFAFDRVVETDPNMSALLPRKNCFAIWVDYYLKGIDRERKAVVTAVAQQFNVGDPAEKIMWRIFRKMEIERPDIYFDKELQQLCLQLKPYLGALAEGLHIDDGYIEATMPNSLSHAPAQTDASHTLPHEDLMTKNEIMQSLDKDGFFTHEPPPSALVPKAVAVAMAQMWCGAQAVVNFGLAVAQDLYDHAAPQPLARL